MLTKLLFTALVIAVVYAVYRTRLGGRPGVRSVGARVVPSRPPSRIGYWAAYGFVGTLALVSAGLYYLHWQEQHRVVTIKVVDGRTGEAVVYRAYKKSISGDRFETLDGRDVRLGASERVEMLETD